MVQYLPPTETSLDLHKLQGQPRTKLEKYNSVVMVAVMMVIVVGGGDGDGDDGGGGDGDGITYFCETHRAALCFDIPPSWQVLR